MAGMSNVCNSLLLIIQCTMYEFIYVDLIAFSKLYNDFDQQRNQWVHQCRTRTSYKYTHTHTSNEQNFIFNTNERKFDFWTQKNILFTIIKSIFLNRQLYCIILALFICRQYILCIMWYVCLWLYKAAHNFRTFLCVNICFLASHCEAIFLLAHTTTTTTRIY